MTYLLKLLTIIIAILTISACSIGKQELENIKKVEDELSQYEKVMKKRADKEAGSRFKVVDGIYLGGETILIRTGDPLPENMPIMGISFPHPIPINTVARWIQSETNIPVRVEGRLGKPQNSEENISPSRVDGAGNQVSGFGLPQAVVSTSNSSDEILRTLMIKPMPFEDLLNIIVSEFGYEWKYENGQLRFMRYKTKTFALNTLPGSAIIKTSVEGGKETSTTASEDVSANGLQQTRMSATLDFWGDLEKTIKTIVPDESNIVISPSSNTLTVSTPTWAMERVENYINEYNKTLARQVVFDVEVYSVTRRNSEGFAFDGNLIFKNLQNKFGFEFRGSAGSLQNSVNALTGTIISPLSSSGLAEFAGSNFIAEVLKELGDVSLVQSVQVMAMNYQSTPVAITNRRGYLKSSRASSLGDGQSTTLEPGVTNTGFMMTILPNIHEDGRMVVQLSLKISELITLDEIVSNNSLIQLPNINSRDIIQRIYVASGEFIVLTGFEQVRNVSNKKDGGFPFSILGVSHEAEQEVTKLYIVIKPVLMNPPEAIYMSVGS